jgi:hypothetical protein
MNKTISMMTFADLSKSGGASTQDGKLKRTVLFTLDEDEQVSYGEYFVLQKMNQNHFACIIRNHVKQLTTFVFNGKRIPVGDCYDRCSVYEYISFHYLNVHEENGYIVEYIFQDMAGYVNVKGELYGPFDELSEWDTWDEGESKTSLTFAKDSNGNIIHDKFYYRKTEGDKRNYYLHYHGEKEGPFDGILFPKENSVYADCEYLHLLAGKWYAHYGNGVNKMVPTIHGYLYQKGEKWCVNINGEESRGYDGVWYLHFTESGNYIYCYLENEKEYININGENSGGYDSIYSLEIIENGEYAYYYKENGKWYVNINGEDSRGYDEVDNLRLTESGKYAYWYNENGKWYVNINGKSSKGYDVVGFHTLRFIENGSYAYTYEENGKEYVNINGKESSGYKDVSELHLTESGNYAYIYKENGKDYVNINGKESRGYDGVFCCFKDLLLTESGHCAYRYIEDKKFYVNININGVDKSSKGYDDIWRLEITDDGNYSYYYYNEGIDGRIYKNHNGEEIETEYLLGMGHDDSLDFFNNINGESVWKVCSEKEHWLYPSDESKQCLYFSDESKHVSIYGKCCGKANALYAWYDKTKRAFVWNAVEGDELVIYEFQLD